MTTEHEVNLYFPLAGKKILVTRARSQNREMVEKIAAFGGKVVEFPVIRFIPSTDMTILDQALEQLSRFDWVIFTSVNGVTFFFERLKEQKVDHRLLQRSRIAAVGPKTAEALANYDLKADIVPNEYDTETLIDILRPLIRAKDAILLPRAKIARQKLVSELSEIGAIVSDISVYETIPDLPNKDHIVRLLQQEEIDMITFTSASTVNYFLHALQKNHQDIKSLLKGALLACIGPITSAALSAHDLEADIVAAEYTIDGLMDAIIQYYQQTT